MSLSGTAISAEATGLAQETPPEEGQKIKGRSTWQLAWARLRQDRAAIVSFVVIVLIILMAIFAPIFATITGHGVYQQFRSGPGAGMDINGLPTGPGGSFVLGADDQGRDLLVRIAYGARTSLYVGVVATLCTVALGAILGLAAGYLGGLVDTLVARLVDLVLSLPYLLFAICLVSVFRPSLTIVIIVIAAFGWAAVARIVRGQVLSIREKEYIEAARSLGANSWRIMFIDVLPNVTAQLIVYATLLIPISIVAEASLSFLGLGVQPPTADWGAMLSESEIYVQAGQAWWYLVFPGLALVITTLAFNVLGDGIRDALDPRLDRI